MTSASPLVSVCIANYNGMAVIDACLNSVMQQQGDIEIEILIHDDASTDDSVLHIRQHYPQATLICSANNVGYCVANNRLVTQARGNYVLLLNNDAALMDGAIQALWDAAGGLGRSAILTLPQYDEASGALVDRGCLLDPFYNPVPNLNASRRDVAMVIGACLWIDRALWVELGGFPDWFGSVAEDMYLCCRARLAGYPVQALAVSGYLHRQGASFGGNKPQGERLSSTFRRRALSERNKTFVMAITCPSPYLQILLPLHIFMLLLEGCVLALLKWDVGYLKGIYLPVPIAVLAQRSAIRATRQTNGTASRSFFDAFEWMPRKLRLLIRHGFPEIR